MADQAQPTPDPLTDLLAKAPIGQGVRADAWDAFHQAANEDDLAAKLQRMPMPQETKAALWDLKHTSAAESSPLMTYAVVNGQRVPITDDDTGVGAFVGHIAKQINPISGVQAVGNAITHPIDTVKAIGAAQGALFDKAKASYASGDYATAARHFVDYLLPLVGPAFDRSSDEMQQGKYLAGAGDAVGLGLSMFGPDALARSGFVAKLPALLKNANPAEREAVQFGQQRGIPVDMGTASGNPAVKGAQVGSEATPGGALATWNAKANQAAALERVGGDLATDALSHASTPEQAGAGIADALTAKIQAHSQYADRSYDALRQIEANPKFARTVVTGTKDVPTGILDANGQPIIRTVQETETIPLPVALRSVKARLKPLYDQLTRQYSVTQAQASAGYKALGNIVSGPDFAPLSQVERDLGAIKSISRGADLPELRSVSQGLAAEGVSQLQTAVDRAAAHAGPDATRALANGRAATKAKFETADVLERFRNEPVQAYRQAIAPKDSGIDLLRTLSKQAPQSLPQIARAWLDDQLATATAEGGFDRSARLQGQWQQLGPQTKALLFPGAQADALDKFFLLAKKIGEQPNPSRSALVGTTIGTAGLLFTEPMTGATLTVGGAMLARILRNPTAVKTFTQGLTLAVAPSARLSATARASALASIFRSAQQAGASAPATAGATP